VRSFGLIGCFLWFVTPLLGCQVSEPAQPAQYVRAEVRRSEVVAAADPQSTRIVITDEKSVSKLLSCFPKHLPSEQEQIGGWIRTIRITLTQANGDIILISTNGRRFDSPWGEWPMSKEATRTLYEVIGEARH